MFDTMLASSPDRRCGIRRMGGRVYALATSLVAEIDELHRRISSDHVELFRALADLDRAGVWKDSGARDCASWISIRYGISEWKARRWLSAAHALETLPAVRDALASGRLGVDKV